MESYQYLDISNEVPLDPIAAPVITGNNASQQFILLANKEISFSDVVGSMSQRSIALDKRWSSSFAEDWLNKHLSDHGASVSDFKKLVVVEKPSQAVLPVFFKKRDLGVTTANSFALMTELNPQLQQQLHVIATSPPLVLFMLCAPETVDQRTRAEITEQLLTLHRQKVGHQILLLSKASSMARVTASQLATIKALAKSSKAGKANDQHKQLTQREDIEQ